MPLFKTMDLLDPPPLEFYLFSAFIMSFKKGNLLIIKGRHDMNFVLKSCLHSNHINNFNYYFKINP